MKFRYLWRRFLRSDNGSSVVEFAFAAPIVILIIAGIIDLMMVLFVTSLMEGGLQSASRPGRTGFQPAGITRTDAIRLEIQDATIGLVDIDDVTITTSVYPCFDAINQPEPHLDENENASYASG